MRCRLCRRGVRGGCHLGTGVRDGCRGGAGEGGEGRRRGSGGGVTGGTTALPLSPLNPAFGLSRFGDAHAGYPVTSERVG